MNFFYKTIIINYIVYFLFLLGINCRNLVTVAKYSHTFREQNFKQDFQGVETQVLQDLYTFHL